jgi:hypothetical protein
MVLGAAPFWLLTFLPLYLAIPTGAVIWRLTVAPWIGLFIGAAGSLLIFGKQDLYVPRDLIFPAAIGCTVFLLGAILKNRFKTAESAG